MFKVFIHFAFAAAIFVVSTARAEKGVNIYQQPRTVPAHKIIRQDGSSYKLSDFKGDFVVAVFWSKTCGPCIRELKSLNGFYNAVKGRGIKLLLISPNEEWQTVEQQKRFLKKYGAPDVEFFVDEHGNVASDLGIFTSPHTVLVNTKGEEIGRIRGSAKWDDAKVINYIQKLKEQHG